MTDSRAGYSLIETVLASAILIVVTGALAMSVKAFSDGQESLSCRASALVIAAEEMAEAESGPGSVAPGSRTVEVDGREYSIDTRLITEDPGGSFIDLTFTVTVTGPSGGPVTLERRFVESKGAGWR